MKEVKDCSIMLRCRHFLSYILHLTTTNAVFNIFY